MSFKVKKEKKQKICETNKTIEQIHDEKLEYFDRLQNSLNRRKEVDVNQVKPKLKFCKNCLDVVYRKECLTCFEKKTTTEISKKEFQQKIKDIQDRKEEIDYYLDIHPILLKYYEDKTEPKTTSKTIGQSGVVKKISYDDTQEIVKDYYKVNKIRYIEKRKEKPMDFCRDCDLEMLETSEKFFVCPGCGATINEKIIDGVSYKDYENYGFISEKFNYKRINYFNEWLSHIQANDQIEIEEETINMIKTELQKERILDSSKVSYQKIKKILKLLKQPKLYENIPEIIARIYNVQPLVIPIEVTEKLKQMFMAIQVPFDTHRENRKNFFSYPYIIYKFCELLGLNDYLQYFNLLKSREKLMKQDILWKKIVDDLRQNDSTSGIEWVYIASV